METVIEIKNLTKIAKDNRVLLNHISFSVTSNTIVGFVGRNGSGKTVLLKLICGLMRVSEGSIYVYGEIIDRKSQKIPSSIGAIIENPGFLENLSGYRNLKYLADIRCTIGKSEIIETMNLVGLKYKEKKPVRNYSLGMRQRLAIAQAIMEKPRLLVLDEPFNGLDNDGVNEMRKLLLGLKGKGTTILISSHNQDDISLLCDETYEIYMGQLRKV